MKIRVENGLPIASLELVYGDNIKTFENVLVDTDLMADIGLVIDFVYGSPTTMYGVGGKGEVCNQQKVSGLYIDNQLLNDYSLQLGMVQDMYGFDGLLGIDFMLKTGLIVDFSTLTTSYKANHI
jgi:hypothetical protein